MNITKYLSGRIGAATRAMHERLNNKPSDWFISLDGEWLQSSCTGFRIRLLKGRTPIGISTVGSGIYYQLNLVERLHLQRPVIDAVNRALLARYRRAQVKAHEPVSALPQMLREQAA